MPNPHWLVDIAVWSVGHLQTKQICILVRPAPKPLTPSAAGLVPCWRAQPLLDVSVRGPSSHRCIVMRELQPGDQVAQGKTTDDLVGTAPEWTRTQHCVLEPDAYLMARRALGAQHVLQPLSSEQAVAAYGAVSSKRFAIHI